MWANRRRHGAHSHARTPASRHADAARGGARSVWLMCSHAAALLAVAARRAAVLRARAESERFRARTRALAAERRARRASRTVAEPTPCFETPFGGCRRSPSALAGPSHARQQPTLPLPSLDVSQISVGVAVGDAAALRGDFDVVSTRDPATGVEVACVNDFKERIIAARRWTRVVPGDLTIVGPYESKAAALSSFSTAACVDSDLSITSIQRLGAKAYVVARVPLDVNLDTGA